jgi:hypothetical protein
MHWDVKLQDLGRNTRNLRVLSALLATVIRWRLARRRRQPTTEPRIALQRVLQGVPRAGGGGVAVVVLAAPREAGGKEGAKARCETLARGGRVRRTEGV